jgi:transposase
MNCSLFVAEGHDGIEGGSAACRDDRSGEHNKNYAEQSEQKRDHIARLDAKSMERINRVPPVANGTPARMATPVTKKLSRRIITALAAVCSVSTKSQIQALDRTQPLMPMRPWQVERGTHDYNGTTSLFAALELKTSRVIGQLHRRHRAQEFRQFLDVIEAQVPVAFEVHIIVGNYGTHKTAIIRKWFAKRPRCHVHFTSTYGSWINLVERWFAELTNKRIRRVFRSVKDLEGAIREYIDVHNEDPKPFVWTKTADQILASIARYALRTTASNL